MQRTVIVIKLGNVAIYETRLCHRLQEMEQQYKREKEEADYLLEQQRLVSEHFCICIYDLGTLCISTS